MSRPRVGVDCAIRVTLQPDDQRRVERAFAKRVAATLVKRYRAMGKANEFKKGYSTALVEVAAQLLRGELP